MNNLCVKENMSSQPAQAQLKSTQKIIVDGIQSGASDAKEIGKFTFDKVKKSRPLQIAIGAGVLVFVAAIVLIIVWFRKKKNQPATTNSVVVTAQKPKPLVVAQDEKEPEKKDDSVTPFLVSSSDLPEFKQFVLSEKLDGMFDDTKSFFDVQSGIKNVDGQEMFENDPFYGETQNIDKNLSTMFV
jgi:hypothetical protein